MSHQRSFPTFAAKILGSHAYNAYEVDRLDDNIIDGNKQKKKLLKF